MNEEQNPYHITRRVAQAEDSGKQEGGTTIHKLNALGMNYHLPDKVRGLGYWNKKLQKRFVACRNTRKIPSFNARTFKYDEKWHELTWQKTM